MSTSVLKAGLLAALLTGTFVVGWEAYWRGQNLPLAYNDDDSLWASTRRQIYLSGPARPVVIGSSRIKFDLDQDRWQQLTGQRPVQLALLGTSPRPVLADLARDPKFRGTLLVDVTEAQFFSPSNSPFERSARQRLKAYPKWSLSQQFSFWLNKKLEARLLFLDEDRLSLGAFANQLPLPNRRGVVGPPVFPRRFTYNLLDRQTRMTNAFVTSPALQAQMRAVWMGRGVASAKRGAGGDTLTALLQSVRHDVDQIRARGGQVLFVRCPSSGDFWRNEQLAYPRALYWNRLLRDTHTPGIHFQDYPALAHFQCPEWSHLTPRDAAVFTQALVPIIEQKTGWALQPAALSAR